MSRTSRDVERTRESLIKAAIAVFATDGYVGASTREIAKVAGVSEVTLFRYFQNKERLLTAVAQHTTNLWMEAFAQHHEWTYNLTYDLKVIFLPFLRKYQARSKKSSLRMEITSKLAKR